MTEYKNESHQNMRLGGRPDNVASEEVRGPISTSLEETTNTLLRLVSTTQRLTIKVGAPELMDEEVERAIKHLEEFSKREPQSGIIQHTRNNSTAAISLETILNKIANAL